MRSTKLRGGSGGLARALVLAAAVGAGLPLAGCAREDVAPFDPRKMGQGQRDGARDSSTAELLPLPTTYKAWEGRGRGNNAIISTRPSGKRVTGDEKPRPISLADVVRRTVVNNLEVRAAGFGPAIEAARIIEAQARFDPTFFTNTTAEISNRQTAGTPFSVPTTQGTFTSEILDRQRQTQFTAASGVRQVLESGGQVEARYQLRQTDARPNSTLIDPYREADLVLQLTQPLLRDSGGEVNRARIEIARANARISMFDFRKAVEDSVDNVEQAYWQLQAAQREVEIQEERVRGATQTADVISARLLTDQSRLQLNQAQAEVETRRAALTRARARVRDLSDQVKQLMNDPELAITGNELLVAETPPLDQPIRFDVDELVNTALVHRLEIAQQQLRVDNATTTLGAAKNNLLPSLNFQGTVNPSGLGEGFGDAIDSQNEFNKVSYSAGLQLEIPIGNREARSIYRRTLLQRMQAITQYQSVVEQVALEVTVRHREVETTFNELSRARAERFARAEALRAILAQEAAAEPLTPQFIDLKLRTQDLFAQARLNESNALSAYNTAISRLEKSKGTLLAYNNISLDERGMRRQLAR